MLQKNNTTCITTAEQNTVAVSILAGGFLEKKKYIYIYVNKYFLYENECSKCSRYDIRVFTNRTSQHIRYPKKKKKKYPFIYVNHTYTFEIILYSTV